MPARVLIGFPGRSEASYDLAAGTTFTESLGRAGGEASIRIFANTIHALPATILVLDSQNDQIFAGLATHKHVEFEGGRRVQVVSARDFTYRTQGKPIPVYDSFIKLLPIDHLRAAIAAAGQSDRLDAQVIAPPVDEIDPLDILANQDAEGKFRFARKGLRLDQWLDEFCATANYFWFVRPTEFTTIENLSGPSAKVVLQKSGYYPDNAPFSIHVPANGPACNGQYSQLSYEEIYPFISSIIVLGLGGSLEIGELPTPQPDPDIHEFLPGTQDKRCKIRTTVSEITQVTFTTL